MKKYKGLSFWRCGNDLGSYWGQAEGPSLPADQVLGKRKHIWHPHWSVDDPPGWGGEDGGRGVDDMAFEPLVPLLQPAINSVYIAGIVVG